MARASSSSSSSSSSMARASSSSSSSMASKMKAYSIPFILFTLSMFYQLFVLPRSFPPSHYYLLGVRRYCSVEEVKDAYEKISSNWNTGAEVPDTTDFIKIRYAYELLTNPIWKRDYDLFGIDEQHDTYGEIIKQYAGKRFSEVEFPLLRATAFDPDNKSSHIMISEDFKDILQNSTIPRLLQVYSGGSSRCSQFYHDWKRIGAYLDGLAYTAMLDVGEVPVAAYLAEKKPTGQFFFRRGLPLLVAFPQGCITADCLVRFEGQLSIDAVTDWFTTTVLGLPRIRYYPKESLVQDFLVKSGPHKVKAILFSRTGERATPVVRQAARDYQDFISFAFVLWREEESSFWWNAFGVDSAPAIVFLKDPGVKPVVYPGLLNNSWFLDILEKNKKQELPQLRSVTSMELGCDARGYSRAGANTVTWYCVILAGRQSEELNKMRETMRRIQELLGNSKIHAVDTDKSSSPAAIALKDNRLTFAWLDGEVQERYCYFYVHSNSSFDTCGPRRDVTDTPRLFTVRYKRNSSEDSEDRKPKSMWDVSKYQEDVDPASQLVALYSGRHEVTQIIQWISNIVADGDTKDLPSYRTKTPELVPEDTEPIYSRGAQSIISSSMGIKQRIARILSRVYDHLGDPRIGPSLLLGALMSFGAIWLSRSQKTKPSQTNQPSRSSTKKEEEPPKQRDRERPRNVSKRDIPPSITDEEPKNAYQMSLSDSDSDE